MASIWLKASIWFEEAFNVQPTHELDDQALKGFLFLTASLGFSFKHIS